MSRAVPGLAMVVLGACSSVGAFQRAETLRPGELEAALEGSTQLAVGRDALTSFPLVGVRARFGLSERVDLSVRAGPAGLEAQPKVLLTSREAPVLVSLSPSLGGTVVAPNQLFGGALHGSLAAFVGIPLRGGAQLVVVPRLHNATTTVSVGQLGGTVNVYSVGGAAGVAVPAGPAVDVIADVGALIPLMTSVWRSDLPPGTAFGSARVTVQLNLTVALKRSR